MTAVALAAIVLAAGLGGVVVWLLYRYVRKVDASTDDRVAVEASISELERAQFERDKYHADADESHRVAETLAEELRHVLSIAPAVGAGLADSDVGVRVLRFFERYQADRAARGLPAEPEPSVSQPTDTMASGGPATTPT